jgi:hypothetical protein
MDIQTMIKVAALDEIDARQDARLEQLVAEHPEANEARLEMLCDHDPELCALRRLEVRLLLHPPD